MQTAVDADRAFAADARQLGQWTAFRKWAASEATMFVPAPVKAQEWLKGRPDPAKSVDWSPTEAFVSCDGNMAVNTGEWRRPDGSVGYFTTVWVKQPNGDWRWVLDHGDALAAPRPPVPQPTVRRASCAGDPNRQRPPFNMYRFAGLGGGGRYFTDPTLRYAWHVNTGFGRHVEIALWLGDRWERVIYDQVAAPK